jgi:hypothetical protein
VDVTAHATRELYEAARMVATFTSVRCNAVFGSATLSVLQYSLSVLQHPILPIDKMLYLCNNLVHEEQERPDKHNDERNHDHLQSVAGLAG